MNFCKAGALLSFLQMAESAVVTRRSPTSLKTTPLGFVLSADLMTEENPIPPATKLSTVVGLLTSCTIFNVTPSVWQQVVQPCRSRRRCRRAAGLARSLVSEGRRADTERARRGKTRDTGWEVTPREESPRVTCRRRVGRMGLGDSAPCPCHAPASGRRLEPSLRKPESKGIPHMNQSITAGDLVRSRERSCVGSRAVHRTSIGEGPSAEPLSPHAVTLARTRSLGMGGR